MNDHSLDHVDYLGEAVNVLNSGDDPLFITLSKSTHTLSSVRRTVCNYFQDGLDSFDFCGIRKNCPFDYAIFGQLSHLYLFCYDIEIHEECAHCSCFHTYF